MLETKEKLKEREIREAAENRRREKEEDAAILKRLREQIRLDKYVILKIINSLIFSLYFFFKV